MLKRGAALRRKGPAATQLLIIAQLFLWVGQAALLLTPPLTSRKKLTNILTFDLTPSAWRSAPSWYLAQMSRAEGAYRRGGRGLRAKRRPELSLPRRGGHGRDSAPRPRPLRRGKTASTWHWVAAAAGRPPRLLRGRLGRCSGNRRRASAAANRLCRGLRALTRCRRAPCCLPVANC